MAFAVNYRHIITIFNLAVFIFFIGECSYITPKEVTCAPNLRQEMLKTYKTCACKPRETLVDISHMVKGLLAPNQVVLKKCGGGTCHHHLSCIPTNQTTVNIPILVSPLDKCHTLPLMEDTACVCGCAITEENCKYNQYYDQSLCMCKCHNREGESGCTYPLEWDEDNCKCRCSLEMPCTTGSYWISDLCRCARLSSDSGKNIP